MQNHDDMYLFLPGADLSAQVRPTKMGFHRIWKKKKSKKMKMGEKTKKVLEYLETHYGRKKHDPS